MFEVITAMFILVPIDKYNTFILVTFHVKL